MAWPGGTWSGRCGTTRWIESPRAARDRFLIEFSVYDNDFVRRSVAAYKRDPAARGYRVECRLPRGHAGDCGLGVLTSWEFRPWKPT
jgi:hypothetical protein